MDELLNFLQHTYKKYAGMERDKKSIVLEISRNDLQILIESVKQMGKAKMFQDEIDQLKAQHAEETSEHEAQKAELLKEITRLNEANYQSKDMEELKIYLEETEQKLFEARGICQGYRQAVKDILGGVENE